MIKDKERDIASIYKILPIYEGIENPDSPFNWDGYLSYLNDCYIRWVGNKEQNDIVLLLMGLIKLGDKVTHKDVKRTVFHMISLIEKGD